MEGQEFTRNVQKLSGRRIFVIQHQIRKGLWIMMLKSSEPEICRHF